jgi:general secretion pathway protein N
MMRVRLPLGRFLFFLAAFLFSLAALLPLRLALGWLGLDQRGLAAREAAGSVWLGLVREARVGAIEAGDLEARLATLPLLLGRARLQLDRAGEGEPFEGAASVSRHGFGLDDITARLPLGTALSPLPIAALDLDDLSVRFADGLCRSADGGVKASLGGAVGGVSLPASLSGNARCDGGALLLPLAAPSGMETLAVRLSEDGRYRAELAVRAADPAQVASLAAAGFALADGAYRLRFDGEL